MSELDPRIDELFKILEEQKKEIVTLTKRLETLESRYDETHTIDYVM